MNLDTKNLMHNFQEFIDYVFSFYGQGGLYPLNVTKEQIAFATLKYLDDCNDPFAEFDMTWGEGDSLDRERVRDYMMDIYHISYGLPMPV